MILEYKVTDFYDPADEMTLIWNDPDLAIEWPVAGPVLSVKDGAGLRLRDIMEELPVYEREMGNTLTGPVV